VVSTTLRREALFGSPKRNDAIALPPEPSKGLDVFVAANWTLEFRYSASVLLLAKFAPALNVCRPMVFVKSPPNSQMSDTWVSSIWAAPCALGFGFPM